MWDLESDYYLHVGGRGEEFGSEDNKKLAKRISDKALTLSSQNSRKNKLYATSPCRLDFHRLKMTSFDKLQQICGPVTNVRLYTETGPKGAEVALRGVARDAAEVQLKSPNWLYGQRRPEKGTSPSKSHTEQVAEAHAAKVKETKKELEDLDWLTNLCPSGEEELFARYVLVESTDDDSWYGTKILPGTVEESAANQHYLQCCKGPSIDPWDWTSTGGMDSFQTVADVIQEQDEDMMRMAMESAISQFQTVGSSVPYNQIMPLAPAGSDCMVTFRDWLPRDNSLCKVLS